MPELPEVETIRTKLGPLISGKLISQIEIFKEKSFHGDISQVEGQKVVSLKRRAKILQLELSNALSILVHLKMTGQLIYVDKKTRIGGGHPTADWVNELPSKHTRVIVSFSDGSTLFFNDMRIFGWLKVVDALGLQQEFKNFGPDINDPQLRVEALQKNISKRKIPIKQAMMMNTIVAGMGNIYICDALNLARISPMRPSYSLSRVEIEQLIKASREVIARGIQAGGATIHDYTDIDGFAGAYQDQVLVYGREGKNCKNCGQVIKKRQLGGRGTYYCPFCQV